jgi:cyclic pyranopterin phosphate synthase
VATPLIQLRPECNWSPIRPRVMPGTRLLRLSVTDRCNFRCRYCMPVEGAPPVSHRDLLSFGQLSEMVAWLSRYTTIERVKLTGGEPLVRRGLEP